MQVDECIVLYFKLDTYGRALNKTFWPKPFEKKPLVAALDQRDAGTGGNTTTIAGHKFLMLKTDIVTANAHHDVGASGISKEFMERLFDRK